MDFPIMYLVTGCDGYFGSALIFELERLQIKTIGLARNTSVFEEFKFSHVSFYDYTFLDELVNYNIRIIVHCAGLSSTRMSDYRTYYEANVQLTERVASFARYNKVSHFFYFSSVKVYGANYCSDLNVNSVSIESLYAQSKFEAERALKEYKFSFFVHILRLPNIVISPRIELKSYSLLTLDLCYQIVNYGNIRLKSDLNTVVTILPGLIIASYLIDEPERSGDIEGYEIIDFCDGISISLADFKSLVEEIYCDRSEFQFGLNTRKYNIEQFQSDNILNSKVITEFGKEEVLAMISKEISKTLNFFKSKL